MAKLLQAILGTKAAKVPLSDKPHPTTKAPPPTPEKIAAAMKEMEKNKADREAKMAAAGAPPAKMPMSMLERQRTEKPR